MNLDTAKHLLSKSRVRDVMIIGDDLFLVDTQRNLKKYTGPRMDEMNYGDQIVIWNILGAVSGIGATALLTSSIISGAAQLTDNVWVMVSVIAATLAGMTFGFFKLAENEILDQLNGNNNAYLATEQAKAIKVLDATPTIRPTGQTDWKIETRNHGQFWLSDLQKETSICDYFLTK